jgi:diaminohydroxyphosphoribosylaminopyrimidine deaminase / 5-amino-6-(5-phosphoribosylamino)uracil reductase
MPTEDERFMAVALEIAAQGRGAVEPNPMVGAVLASGGAELSRGWHRRFGWPHAEAEALAAAEEAGRDPHGATLYVSLEPCCHFGKTPPCTRAIIEAGVARVVAAMRDPDEKVAGKGLEELRRAGVEVACGVLEEQARDLLAPYVKLRTKRRPWVICKWAQTSDGLLALPGRRWISCEDSRRDAHRLRGLCDGVCVGIGTALADDPMLTNRLGEGYVARARSAAAPAGRQPARVVLDSHLRLPTGAWLAQTARTTPLIVATTREGLAAEPDRAAVLRQSGAEVLALPDAPGGVSLEALLDELGQRQWTYLLVEGGAKVLRSFLHAGLADELAVYVAPARPEDEAGQGAQPPSILPGPRFDIEQVLADLPWRAVAERDIGADRLRQFRAKRRVDP